MSAQIRKQRWDKKQGCALNLKAHPLEIHFLQLSPPSLQFHTLSMKCHYQGTKYTNTWDHERYFIFRPKHKSIFLFHNSFLCLCCYRKVHSSLNILSFRPLYLKKIFEHLFRCLSKVNTVTLNKGKLYNYTCMELTANTYRYNIDNTCIHVYACKYIWTVVCMSLCGLAVVLWRKCPP